MRLRELHRRYRTWAAGIDSKTSVAVGGGVGALAAGVLGLAGSETRATVVSDVLPWLLVVAGPIAALDAWGAAEHRGRPGEGRVRAAIIVGASWLLALVVASST